MSDPDLTLRAELPPAEGPSIAQTLAAAREQRVADRLAEGDATLWGPAGTPEIANRLGWLTIAERMLDELLEIERVADGVHTDAITDAVLLGMGGSSLAPEVFRRAFAGARAPAVDVPGALRLHVLDSTDPSWIADVQEAVDPARTLFIVSSKSGGTIEPLSLFAHFYSLREDGANFIAITDPGSGLARLATEHGFRHVFYGDPDIGGRYSALSPFGIVPATLMGVDTAALLQQAPRAWQAGAPDADAGLPGAVWLGATLAALARGGRDKLTFAIAPSLPGLGLWLEQLFAESTGKQGTGILPVADEPLGAPGDYGPDRVFAHLPDASAPDAEAEERLAALAAAGHPVITIPTTGPADLGRVFLLAEIAVAVAGWGLEINPFDQPNVQQAKDATNRVLEGYEQSGELPDVAAAGEAELRELLLGAGPPAYVALMGYLEPSEPLDAAVAELREAVRAATRATTTFGYGPRFLHSTGQFHKGGPKVGRFLQLLVSGERDVSIPGRAYTFGTLEEAQAIGDVQTLRELGLPAERVRLQGGDRAAALRALTSKIREWT